MRWQKIRLWLAILALLTLSVLGFQGLINEWQHADTLGRQFSTCMQSAYSLLGIAAIVVLLMKQGWGRWLLYPWAAAMILTGVGAPVVWGQSGWWMGLFAAAVTALFSALTIWLAPLPAANPAFKRWRWWVAGVFVVCVLLVLSLSLAVPYVPLVVRGTKMEAFCEGMRHDVDRTQLQAIAEQQGYTVQTETDAKAPYLRIQDDASLGQYFCEARFRKDGSLSLMNFKAGANARK